MKSLNLTNESKGKLFVYPNNNKKIICNFIKMKKKPNNICNFSEFSKYLQRIRKLSKKNNISVAIY